MHPKSDIPNQSGFRLLLIRADETTLPCVVQQTADGSFATFSLQTRQRVTESEPWANFIGWREIPKSPAELHLESLPAFPNLKRSSVQFLTKDQLIHQKRPVPKKGDASITCSLNRLERITLTPAKAMDGKQPLYCLEFWQRTF